MKLAMRQQNAGYPGLIRDRRLQRNILWLLLLFLVVSCGGSGEIEEIEREADQAGADGPVVVEEPISLTIDVQGHRGARGLKPENSLPAFETALDLGVSTLELDLHFTADGEVVIWHDERIEGSKCGVEEGAVIDVPDPDSLIKWGEALMISQLTLGELASYRCDRNPDEKRFPEQTNEATLLARDTFHIVTLSDLFDFVIAYSLSTAKSEFQRANASQVQFNIETKRKPDNPKAINDGFDGVNPSPFEQEILRVVALYGMEDRVIIQSFDHRSLWAIRSVNERIRLAALTSRTGADPSGYAASGADIWSPNYTELTQPLLDEAHEAGLLVIPWTVNDPDDMDELLEMGVDGLISDRPDIIIAKAP
jgi:glycerophosphoryl diester phosphodiesterase